MIARHGQNIGEKKAELEAKTNLVYRSCSIEDQRILCATHRVRIPILMEPLEKKKERKGGGNPDSDHNARTSCFCASSVLGEKTERYDDIILQHTVSFRVKGSILTSSPLLLRTWMCGEISDSADLQSTTTKGAPDVYNFVYNFVTLERNHT